ncbi:MAG: PLDc N-terminal domain-containing protein [Clostridium sp.]
MEVLKDNIALLLPLIILNLGLMGVSYFDLIRRDVKTLKLEKKWPWALLILLQIVGPVIYLVSAKKSN